MKKLLAAATALAVLVGAGSFLAAPAHAAEKGKQDCAKIADPKKKDECVRAQKAEKTKKEKKEKKKPTKETK
jgi:hypothetical protein